MGPTTLTGNPKFDSAANTTLTLGPVNDGGSARTITQQNTGSLAFGGAAVSLVDGTQVNITGGSVSSTNPTGLGTLPESMSPPEPRLVSARARRSPA